MSSVAQASPSRSRSGVTPKSCSAIAAPAAWSENSISVRSGSEQLGRAVLDRRREIDDLHDAGAQPALARFCAITCVVTSNQPSGAGGSRPPRGSSSATMRSREASTSARAASVRPPVSAPPSLTTRRRPRARCRRPPGPACKHHVRDRVVAAARGAAGRCAARSGRPPCPASIDPHTESRPSASAPPSVANRSTSRTPSVSSCGMSRSSSAAWLRARPLGLQPEPHLREQVAAVVGDDVAAEARREPALQRPREDREAHAHLQLGLGGQRDRRARRPRAGPARGWSRRCSARAPGGGRAAPRRAAARPRAGAARSSPSRCAPSPSRPAPARAPPRRASRRTAPGPARSAPRPCRACRPRRRSARSRTRRASASRSSGVANAGSASGTGNIP